MLFLYPILGNKSIGNKKSPELVPSDFYRGLGITDISLGAHHVATLLRDPGMRYQKEKRFEFNITNLLIKFDNSSK